MGHFVSSPREREKRDRRDSRRDEREGQGGTGMKKEEPAIRIAGLAQLYANISWTPQ